ncbi:MAG: amino acid adenylation domain-containing protein [Burkholderiales bacterium]|nr:amino acid adenylation domain-containing protein [Burkholderiales bacterium]
MDNSVHLASNSSLSKTKRDLLTARLRGQVLIQSKKNFIPKCPKEISAQLSFAQQRLWFLHQIAPDSSVYNVPIALRLEGELDLSALEEAFNILIERHEVLKTSFTEVNGRPVATINTLSRMALPIIDLTDASKYDQDNQVRQLASEEAKRPFSLESHLMIRGNLIRLSNTIYVLLITIHHIACDGWSMHVLVKEMGKLYKAVLDKRPVKLPDLLVQYSDFAYWQRNYLQGEVLEQHLSYWRKQLSDLPVLDFPTDYPRVSVPIYDGGTVDFQIPQIITTRLKALNKNRGVTLFTTLLAVFSLILSRYTGQTDISTGTVIANRNRIEIEGLIGFFVNALPLRVNMEGNPKFTELLERTRNIIENAYEHQDLPFDKLVEDLKLPRDTARNPVFQVSLALNNTPKSKIEFEGLDISSIDADIEATQFDLTVHFYESDDKLQGTIAYNTSLFDSSRIKRMAEHIKNLLEGIVNHHDKRISEFSILSRFERNQLLVDFNTTRIEYSSEKLIHELFEEQTISTPEAIAVTCGGASLDYNLLNRKANQLAHYLIANGISKNTFVGLCVDRSLEMVIGILGILKAGAAYVPIDPDYPDERISFLLKDTSPILLLTQEFLLDRLIQSFDIKCICLDKHWPLIAQYSPVNPQAVCVPSNFAYVIYTSGSTGNPKGVVITHRNVVHTTLARIEYYQERVECFLLLSSFSFDSSVAGIFWTLCQGGVLTIPSKNILSDPELVTDLINQEKVTHLLSVPSWYIHFLSSCSVNPESLKVIIVAGEICQTNLVKQHFITCPKVNLFNEYGPTEGTVWASVQQLTICDDQQIVPIGRPIANTCIYILDKTLNPVPVGIAGELYLGGYGLAVGYLNRPILTAERFIPNPYSSQPGERFYQTGDLACFRDDGTIEYLGRIDNQIKLRGYRIELEEIEAKLLLHPNVEKAVVTAYEPIVDDWRLAAYVQTDLFSQNMSDTSRDTAMAEQLTEWQSAINEWYAQSVNLSDPNMNFIGWQSSFTGEAIPVEEMQEWVEQIVSLVRRYKPRRVLEIGCGSGLLLFRLAQNCERYVGTDFSLNALRHVREGLLTADYNLPQVELLHRRAEDFSGLEQNSFDMVILNSVIQYFPDVRYLNKVLQSAKNLLIPGGHLIIGDVRHYGLLQSFHTAVELYHADDSMPSTDLWRRIQSRVNMENELLLDPRFFYALAQDSSDEINVEVLPKRGHYQNEMVQFRYDVVLSYQADNKTQTIKQKTIAWAELTCLDAIQKLLLCESPDYLAIHSVPNSRISQAAYAAKLLEKGEVSTVEGLRQLLSKSVVRGVDPEAIYKLAVNSSYNVCLSWVRGLEEGCFDIFFSKFSLPPLADWIDLSGINIAVNDPTIRLYNNPLKNRITQQLTQMLRDHLQIFLPAYMHPSAYLFINKMPVGPNGKVDRAALPLPDNLDLVGEDYEPARTSIEEILVSLWSESLGVSRIGIHDDFFRLGGHSLMTVRLVKRIRERLGKDVPLISIFQAPTVAKYSAWFTDWSDNSRQLLVRLRSGAGNLPLYCIYSGAGDLRGYDYVVDRFGSSQPIYGIQWIVQKNHESSPDLMELLAKQYAQVLSEHSTGPYMLLGWSLGGLIAYKIAEELERNGKSVCFLGIIDSFLPAGSKSVEKNLGISSFERYLHDSKDVKTFRNLDPQDYAELENITLGLSYEECMFRIGIWGRERGYWLQNVSEEYMHLFVNLMCHSRVMINSFQPTMIGSDINVWWASDSWIKHKNRPLDWGQYTTGKIYESVIEGDHFHIMQDQRLHSELEKAIDMVTKFHKSKLLVDRAAL